MVGLWLLYQLCLEETVAKAKLGAVVSFGAVSIMIVVGTMLWKAFVVECLWSWFVTDAFHASSISYSQALGICLLAYLFTKHRDEDREENEERWKKLMIYAEAGVPGENRQELRFALKKADLDPEKKEPYVEMTVAVIKLLGEPIGVTMVLILGLLVHLFGPLIPF